MIFRFAPLLKIHSITGYLCLVVLTGCSLDSKISQLFSTNAPQVRVQLVGPSHPAGFSDTEFSWDISYQGAVSITLVADDILLPPGVQCDKEVVSIDASTRRMFLRNCQGESDQLRPLIKEGTAVDEKGLTLGSVSEAVPARLGLNPELLFGVPSTLHGNRDQIYEIPLVWQGLIENKDLTADQILLQGGANAIAGCAVRLSSNKNSLFVEHCTGNGNFTLRLPEGAGKGGGRSTSLVQSTFSLTVDNIPPNLTIGGINSGGNPVSLKNSGSVSLGWSTGDIRVENPSEYVEIHGATEGCIPSFSSATNYYSIKVENCSALSGQITVTIREGFVRDAAGNISAAKTSHAASVANPLIVKFAEFADVVEEGVIDQLHSIKVQLSHPAPNDVEVEYLVSKYYSTANSVQHNLTDGILTIPQGHSQGIIQYIYHGNSNGGLSKSLQLSLGEVNAGNQWVEVQTQNFHRLIRSNPPLFQYASIAGRSRVCGLSPLGRLRCWGESPNHLNTTSFLQGDPASDSRFTQFSSDGGVHCAIDSSKKVQCWGYSTYGAIGTGSLSANLATPTRIQSNNLYSTVSVGRYHVCATREDGRVDCWGYNSGGRLGNGGTTSSGVPLEATHPEGEFFVSVSVSTNHSCALTQTGKVYCWGANNGRLGNGATAESKVPQLVVGDHRFTGISVADDFSCGVRLDGRILCWGANYQGGLGTTSDIHSEIQTAPVLIASSDLFKKVVNVQGRACALTLEDSLVCWGGFTSFDSLSGYEQPLLNATSTYYKPRVVHPSRKFSDVILGTYGTCALTVEGHVYCLATDDVRRGVERVRRILTPELVKPSVDFKEVMITQAGVCGLDIGGNLHCTGRHQERSATVPLSAYADHSFSHLNPGYGFNFNCGLKADSTLWCWGRPSYMGNMSMAWNPVPPTLSVQGMKFLNYSAGDSRSCGVSLSGELICWGLINNAPQAPEVVDTGVLYTQVVTGIEHTCALTTTGLVKCWGAAGSALGNGDGSSAVSTPAAIAHPLGETFTKISLGSESFGETSVCGLTASSKLYCWGEINSSATPQLVPGGYLFQDVSTSDEHTCGITSTDGTLLCWGRNDFGQLGNGTKTDSSTPITVGTGFSAVATGLKVTCALKDSKMYCWGNDQQGLLGQGALVEARLAPTPQ